MQSIFDGNYFTLAICWPGIVVNLPNKPD
jgi:hypothetical protein